MRRYQGQTFAGGLNNARDPSLIRDNELQDCLNVRLDLDGSIRKRTGSSKLVTDTSTITDILQINSSTFGKIVIMSNLTKVEQYDPVGPYIYPLTGALTSSTYGLLHQFDNQVMFANGKDNIQQASVDNLVFSDLVSPGAPTVTVLGSTGTVGDGLTSMSYKTTLYDSVSGVESSGGVASAIITPNLKQIEVDFDQSWDKARANAIVVDSYKVYRKEGTNAYKQITVNGSSGDINLSFPIYFELATSVSSTDVIIQVSDVKTLNFIGNFYIKIDSEIMLVTGVIDNKMYVARAQKSTTASNHTSITSIIYMYGFLDGVPAINGYPIEYLGWTLYTGVSNVAVTFPFNTGIWPITTITNVNHVYIDTEAMLVGSVTGPFSFGVYDFNITTRGALGTSNASHSTAAPIYWLNELNGSTTFNLGTTIPSINGFIEQAKYMTHAKERFIFANSSAHPSRVWYSSINSETLTGDASLIKESNYYDIGLGDGDQVTGLAIYNDNIVVFKENSTWYIVGISDIENASVICFARDIGCSSHHSIVEYYGGLLFLSRQGIIYMNGQTMTNLSKYFIPSTIGSINWTYANLSRGVYLDKYNEYWLSIPTGANTANNTTIVLNLLLSDLYNSFNKKCFTIFNRPLTASAIVVNSSNVKLLYSGDNYFNLIQEDVGLTDYTTTAVAISSYATTKNISLSFDFHKTWRRIITDYEAQTGTLTLLYTTPGGSGTDSITQTGSGRLYNKFGINGENGLYINLKYSNASATESFHVYNYTIDYKTHKIR